MYINLAKVIKVIWQKAASLRNASVTTELAVAAFDKQHAVPSSEKNGSTYRRARVPFKSVPALRGGPDRYLYPVAPPGFCDRGESEVWVYRGSRVRSPPVQVVLSVYQPGSLLGGLAMYLSFDTKKFHDNESTHILHNFLTSTHSGEKLPPSPPWRRHCLYPRARLLHR